MNYGITYGEPVGEKPRQVKLYYLGGITNPSRKITYISSYGRAFALPPIGGYLQVDEFMAHDIINRNKVGNKETKEIYECFTLDARIAKRVANGENIHAPILTKAEVMKNISDEELEMLLAQRGKKIAQTRKRSAKKQNDLDLQSQEPNEGEF
jgi:hypothetical protein